MEQSYIENILRLNKGKKAKVFAAFLTATTGVIAIFDGIIEEAGKRPFDYEQSINR